MTRFRGEEQPGFLELVGTWLSQQSWFPGAPSRRAITRIGGLRLPAPSGDGDQGLHLEMHVFDVALAGGRERVAIPMALRSRPSALAGKTALVGRLGTPQGEMWVYDGARDRAFLAAWHEMARRQQGSRNGRSRGEAFADFDAWPAFTAKLQREPLEAGLTTASRTAVTAEPDDEQSRQTVVDFIRRPEPHRAATLDTVMRMARTGSRTVARVLGVVTGSWPEPAGDAGELRWVSGDLGIIREAALAAPDAAGLARTALMEGSDFTAEARQLGRVLGDFHSDLAATFGAYPQTGGQLGFMVDRAGSALQEQWATVRADLDESEATDLAEVVDLLKRQLRDADQSMTLQKIHGDLTANRLRRGTGDRGWIIDEAGGMVDHALPMRDVVTALMSLADLVMDTAHAAPDVQEPEGGTPDPVDFGLWYEQVTKSLLQGYRDSEADGAGIDSVFFHVAMLTEALELFHRWDGRWVFRPSMLLQSET
ncbi:maltokinase N-terminal cap-like domain-containing protein [Nesterenkonia lutea]|uniref:Maltokinase n=1 Tax=Nesterenkonia lutea TaxID=272919 RepID=A0ABR9JI25_9MICC|nr:hypothetical protein [Nesterenkonia lutea]MBE1525476.1 hypothetical protein [Nesterenkonia lutea]